MNELTDQQIATIKDAASKLTGTKRRAFQAQVALDYLEGSPRRAERVFGWWRNAVELGLNEQRHPYYPYWSWCPNLDYQFAVLSR